MFQLSKIWSYETRVPHLSQVYWKSKALIATLRDTKPKDNSDNEDDRILNAFTAIVNPTEEIVEDVDEEEELVESKFERMNK